MLNSRKIGDSAYELMPARACGSTLVVPRCMMAALQFAFQWFSDPAVEREYRYFAFAPHIGRLSCLLYLGSVCYAVLSFIAVVTYGFDGRTLGLRLGLACAGLVTGSLLRYVHLTPRTSTAIILLLLVSGGLLPNYLTAGSDNASASDETFEQTISFLLGCAGGHRRRTTYARPSPRRRLPCCTALHAPCQQLRRTLCFAPRLARPHQQPLCAAFLLVAVSLRAATLSSSLSCSSASSLSACSSLPSATVRAAPLVPHAAAVHPRARLEC